MAQVLGTNLSSIKAQNSLGRSNNAMQVALDRLSSGNRINSAKDDAAGLAISNRFSSQIRGLEQATRNANDAISVAQIAEGAMTEVGDILQRIRELAVQASNASNTQSDLNALNNEMNDLKLEVDRISNSVDFNGTKLLNGELSNKLFQVGYKAGDTISLSVAKVDTASLGINNLALSTAGTVITEQVSGEVIDVVNLNNSTISATDITGSESLIEAQKFNIDGVEVNIEQDSSMKDIAAGINDADISGISGSATNNIRLDKLSHAGTVSFDLYNVNKDGKSSVDSINVNITDESDLTALAQYINANNSNTGITAKTLTGDNSVLILTQADGSDVSIENFDSAATEAVSMRVTSYAETSIYRVELDEVQNSGTGASLSASVHYQRSPGSGVDVNINIPTPTSIDINSETLTLSNTMGSAFSVAREINNAIENNAASSLDGVRAGAYTDIRLDWNESSWSSAGGTLTIAVSDGDAASSENGNIIQLSELGNYNIDDVISYFNSGVESSSESLKDLRAIKITAAQSPEATDQIAFISETGKNIYIRRGGSVPSITVHNYSTGTKDPAVSNVSLSDSNGNVYGFLGSTYLESDSSFTTSESANNSLLSSGTHNSTLIDESIHSTTRSSYLVDNNNSSDIDSVLVRGKLTIGKDSNQDFAISSSNSGNNLTRTQSIISKSDGETIDSIAGTYTAEAKDSISKIDSAIQMISLNRAELGSKHQRLNHAINSMSKAIENVSAARSRVMDADYAKETAAMIKNQILQQAGVSVLAQANQMPQNILKLIG